MPLTSDQKKLVLGFLAQHPTAVLATASPDGQPAAAVVLFAEAEDLSIIFGTHPTRKYTNLKANPAAAMVMTKDYAAVQLHGQAVELRDSDAAKAKTLFMAKHPEASQQLLTGTVFFRFTPSWVRFLNTGVKPPVQFESGL